jgi:hypothetical protein
MIGLTRTVVKLSCPAVNVRSSILDTFLGTFTQTTSGILKMHDQQHLSGRDTRICASFSPP